MSEPLYSWGNFPEKPQSGHSSNWRGDLPHLMERVSGAHGVTLPYGNGRSYGDSCLASSDHVLCMRGLDRFIDADWEAGTVCAEAGITLAEILAIAIPRG